jgi:hypothetical protein
LNVLHITAEQDIRIYLQERNFSKLFSNIYNNLIESLYIFLAISSTAATTETTPLTAKAGENLFPIFDHSICTQQTIFFVHNGRIF